MQTEKNQHKNVDGLTSHSILETRGTCKIIKPQVLCYEAEQVKHRWISLTPTIVTKYYGKGIRAHLWIMGGTAMRALKMPRVSE